MRLAASLLAACIPVSLVPVESVWAQTETSSRPEYLTRPIATLTIPSMERVFEKGRYLASLVTAENDAGLEREAERYIAKLAIDSELPCGAYLVAQRNPRSIPNVVGLIPLTENGDDVWLELATGPAIDDVLTLPVDSYSETRARRARA